MLPGRHQPTRLLEELMRDAPSTATNVEPLLFNLSTFHELRSDEYVLFLLAFPRLLWERATGGVPRTDLYLFSFGHGSFSPYCAPRFVAR